MKSPFLIAQVREGQEDLTKFEVSALHQDAKFSFSRPGFLSFKRERPWTLDSLSRFATILRASLFVGKWHRQKGWQWVPGWDSESIRYDIVQATWLESPTSSVKGDLYSPACCALEDFRDKFSEVFYVVDQANPKKGAQMVWNSEGQVRDRVLNLHLLSEDEVWLSMTKLGELDWGWPGGASRIEQPETAPSRAAIKILEVISILERTMGRSFFLPGEKAIEIGAAPGGACSVLLERGLEVTGVDRGEMDPRIKNHPRLNWISSSIGDWFWPADLQSDWLLVDMNADPAMAVRETRRIMRKLSPGLKGLVFTMKLNQPEFYSVATRLAGELVDDLSFQHSFLKMLPSHHREMAFFGLKDGLPRR